MDDGVGIGPRYGDTGPFHNGGAMTAASAGTVPPSSPSSSGALADEGGRPNSPYAQHPTLASLFLEMAHEVHAHGLQVGLHAVREPYGVERHPRRELLGGSLLLGLGGAILDDGASVSIRWRHVIVIVEVVPLVPDHVAVVVEHVRIDPCYVRHSHHPPPIYPQGAIVQRTLEYGLVDRRGREARFFSSRLLIPRPFATDNIVSVVVPDIPHVAHPRCKSHDLAAFISMMGRQRERILWEDRGGGGGGERENLDVMREEIAIMTTTEKEGGHCSFRSIGRSIGRTDGGHANTPSSLPMTMTII